jgi:hypothetical protein
MSRSLGNIKDLAHDERIWCVAARVERHDGESSHYFITDEGHIAISCKSQVHGTPITALLSGGSDDASGYWKIPTEGTEVFIGFDMGEYEGDAFIISVHGNAPPSGINPSKTYLTGDNVILGEESGSEPTIMGNTYRSAEDVLIAAMSTAFAAINTYAVGIKPTADPSNLFTPALTLALVTTWTDAVAAFTTPESTYLTTKVVVK